MFLKLLKKLKWLWYALFFIGTFIVMLYLTFPANALRGVLKYQLEEALAAEAKGKWEIPPEVEIGTLSLWRFPGVSLEEVAVTPGSFTNTTLEPWEFDAINLRLGLLSTLFGSPKFNFDFKLYSGRANGSVTINSEGGLSQFWFNIEGIDLKKLAGLDIGLPLGGIVKANADFDLGRRPSKDGEGEMSLNSKGLSVGPGELMLPMPGMMGGISVPKVNLGDLTGKIALEKGKGKTQELGFEGGDVEGKVNLSVELNQDLLRSRLDGDGWFKIDDKFLEANPSYKTIFEVSPDLKNAKDADGKYWFHLKGTVGMPFPKFGKKKDKK